MNLSAPLPKGIPSVDEPIEVFASKLGRTINISYSSAINTDFLRKNGIRITDPRMPNRVAREDDEITNLKARLRALEMEKASGGFEAKTKSVQNDEDEEGGQNTEIDEPNIDQWRGLTLANKKQYAKGLGIEFLKNASEKTMIELIEQHQNN